MYIDFSSPKLFPLTTKRIDFNEKQKIKMGRQIMISVIYITGTSFLDFESINLFTVQCDT